MSTPRSKEKATGLKEKPTGKAKTAVVLSDVNVGDALPELSIPLTASLIVAGALASRDFTPAGGSRRFRCTYRELDQ